MALKQRGEAVLFPVIIEANDDYYLGRLNATKDLLQLVTQVSEQFSAPGVTSPQVVSIGGDQNPYLKAQLTPASILALVDADLLRANGIQDETKTAGAQVTPEETPSAVAPHRVLNYLLVRRMWYDFPLQGLIDQSVSTVKADAARRAFLAEGRQIVWAVIDSGIDRTHLHFAEMTNLNVIAPVVHCDFTIPDGAQGSDTALVDKFGHGTHVAGIIAGNLRAEGQQKIIARRTRLGGDNQVETFAEELPQIAGMAPCCKLVSMKVLDDEGKGNVSNIIAAIDKIQTINDFGRNLKVHGVNLSVGYEFDPVWFACGQSPVCVEVNRLVRSGVVVVIAAGNTGYGAVAANARGTGAGLMLTINDPGNAELAITVGSTHRDAPHIYGVSFFSSKGPTGDGRMKPDLVAPGERILSCCSAATAADNAVNSYVEESGTSMAAPHVSGVIAAFLSIRREYIGFPEKVKDLFTTAATDLGRNAYFQGRGLVDLMRAIQSV